MPGAWERVGQPPQVGGGNGGIAICIPVGGSETYHEWAANLKKVREQVKRPCDIVECKGMPIDVARNQLVEAALKKGSEWIFFLDSDVVPKEDNCIERMIATMQHHGMKILSGLYIGKKHEGWFPCAWKKVGNNKFSPLKPDLKPGIYEVDVVGAGLLMIHRSVFEAMKPPWFLWTKNTYDKDGKPRADDMVASEDFVFCLQAAKLGFKTFLDMTIKADHMGVFKITPDPEPKVVLPEL